VASLIFVGLEVRNSGNAVEAQLANSIAAGFAEFNYLIASDPEIARIEYLGFRNPDALTGPETIRASAIIRGLLGHYRQIHSLYEAGILTEAEWSRHALDMNRVIRLPGGKLMFDRNRGYSEKFRKDLSRFDTHEMPDLSSLGRGLIEFE
jgi:hypothetical protein